MINDKRFNLAGMKWLKFLSFILIILVSHGTSFSQVFIKPNNSWGLEYNRIKLDSAAVIPSDTTQNKIVGSVAILNGTFYIKNIFSWDALATGGSGTGGTLTWENVLDNGSDFSHSHLSNGNGNDLFFNDYGTFTINSDQFAVPYLGGGDINNQWITTDGSGNFFLKALPIPVDTSGQFFGNQDLQNTIDYGNRLRHANTIHAVGYDFYIDSLANHSTFSGKTATFDNQTGAYTEIHQDSANAYLYSQSYTGLNISEVRTHQDSAHFQSYDSLGHNARFTVYGKGTLSSYASAVDSLNSPKIVFGDANYKNSDITQVLTTDANGLLGFTSGGGVTGDITWSVLSITNTPPGSPVSGDTYLVGTAGTGAWSGHNNQIATWSGSAWTFSSATTGDLLQNDNDNIVYKFNGTTWVQVGKAPWLVGLNTGINNPKLGTANNTGMGIYTNNTQRLNIGNTGTFTFNSLSGTGTVLMGLGSTGIASRITLGTNLSLSGSTLNASGGGTSALLPTTGSGTATGNVTGDATGFNVTLRHPDTLTLSAASKAILEGINGLNLISNDTINVLSSNVMNITGQKNQNSARTSNIWGYNSNTSDSLGWQVDNTGLYCNGCAFSSNTKNKNLMIDTTTGKLSWTTPSSSGSSLTATQIGFGDGSNALTGSANLTYASSAVTVTNTALGAGTPAPTLKLVNSTAAVNNGQQISPALYLEGQGWKTTATAASMPAAWAILNVPVQGTGAPTENLTFSSNVNNVGWNSRATLSDAGVFSVGTTSSTTLIASSSVQTPVVLSANNSTALALRMGGFVTQNIYATSANTLIQTATSVALPSDQGVTFSVYQPTGSIGTVSNTAGGTTVTGSGTLFLNIFKIGDAITITTNGTVESETITAIASNTSLTTATWTNAHTAGAAYTLTGGNRFAIMGNGLIGIGTATPAAFLDIPAGNANFPQLLLHSSTLLTTPVNGAVEYDGTHMYITIGGVRKQLDN